MLERVSPVGALLASDPESNQRAILEAGEAVHRALRPDMPNDYGAFIEKMFTEGIHLTQLIDAGQVRAIALWRTFPTTYCGRRMEIDDLVTAKAHRSHGFGRTMLQWIEGRAVALGCSVVTLNSAMHRNDAHRFYAREGYQEFGIHFSRTMPPLVSVSVPLTPP